MITAIIQLIRHVPVSLLKDYFSHQSFSPKIDWTSSTKEILKPLLHAIDQMDSHERELLVFDAEHIQVMTDEFGQAALESLSNDRKAFHKMKNAYHRAFWTFLYDLKSFKRAQEIRYADNYLQSSMWDGFIGPKDINITLYAEQILLFEQQIKTFFNIEEEQGKVEIFSRNRINDTGKEVRVFQVMIHLNILSDTYLKLGSNNTLIAELIHPLEELAIIYEPETGQIEISFKGDEHKKAIVKIFAQTLLQSPDGDQVALKRYTISKLLRPYDFATDLEDGIESVKVMFLKIKPLESSHAVAFERTIHDTLSIYEMSRVLFEQHDPLQANIILMQVRLFIRFYPDKVNKRGKLLSVSITHPNGCDIKSKTAKERLIVNKYFKRWGLIEEV